MLDRQNCHGAKLEPGRLADVFKEQLKRVHRSIKDRNISCLVVRHAIAIRDPRSMAESVNSFLDGSLDVAATASVVDPALYRERTRATTRQRKMSPTYAHLGPTLAFLLFDGPTANRLGDRLQVLQWAAIVVPSCLYTGSSYPSRRGRESS
jgi:hypothetical protein